MFNRFTGGAPAPLDRDAQPPPTIPASVPEMSTAAAPPPPAPLGLVLVRLQGLPRVHAALRVHSEQDLQVGVAQAFGFRSTSEFEVQRLPDADGITQAEVRVKTRALLNEVVHIESLFDTDNFEDEVVYSQLSKVSGVPLLRLHRAIPPACGQAVAS